MPQGDAILKLLHGAWAVFTKLLTNVSWSFLSQGCLNKAKSTLEGLFTLSKPPHSKYWP
jgi:hypothetical protein